MEKGKTRVEQWLLLVLKAAAEREREKRESGASEEDRSFDNIAHNSNRNSAEM